MYMRMQHYYYETEMFSVYKNINEGKEHKTPTDTEPL
jgi:hypothetical protein